MEKLRLIALAGVITALLSAVAGCNSRDASPAPPEPSAKTAPSAAGQSKPEAGDCRVEPPARPVACTMQWDPVCGCDGKTYGNACQAKGAGISRYTAGECRGSGAD